jgi:sortase (surface protein transpeptidase)
VARTAVRLLAVVVQVAATVAFGLAEDGPGTGPVVLPEVAAGPVVLPEVGSGKVAVPARLTIPAVDVDVDLVRLGVDDAGRLVPPDDHAVAGWFAAGPAPGAVGPAVLAGHVDSVDGPSVFSRLDEVPLGGEVLVAREDGTTGRFTVTRVEQYPKDAFPTTEVYGPAAGAELRLITCGGDFDRTRRSYLDNVVVYARLAT